MAVAAVAEHSVYHPRDPAASPLWRCLDVHYDIFRRNYPATFEETHGFFRPVVDEVVEDYLECGDLRNGFARIRCTAPGCGKEMLLAFSCKGRWFCPNCHEKKVLQFGEFSVGEVLYPVPHCQMVFTLPRMLRVYFRHHRERLSALCRCAVESLESYLRTLLALPDGSVGVIAVIHTFGDYARFHPHLHLVAADGLFRKTGVFHVAPRAPTQPLEDLFRARVLKLLRQENKLDERQIRALLGWRHSGFGAWRGEPISRRDRRAQENLAQYVMRNPFSAEKMTYVAQTGTVIYRSGMSHGKHKRNFEVFDAPAFIAAVTQHVPPKGFQMVRYYGWYSNRARGERKKLGLTKPGSDVEESQEETVLDVADHRPPRVPSKT